MARGRPGVERLGPNTVMVKCESREVDPAEGALECAGLTPPAHVAPEASLHSRVTQTSF